MSVGMLEAAIGYLPATNVDEDQSVLDLSLYLPVAVFGYLGYLFGFETVVVIPFPIPWLNGDELVFTVTYLRATVYMVAALLFVAHLGSRFDGREGEPRWYDKLCVLVVVFAVVVSLIASL